jgi:hypothetical protein
MLLTSAQHRDIARRAQWYFDCYFGPPGDSVVFTGDGIEDLDELIARLNTNAQYNFTANQRFLCDVGTQYSDWRRRIQESLADGLRCQTRCTGCGCRVWASTPRWSGLTTGTLPITGPSGNHANERFPPKSS